MDIVNITAVNLGSWVDKYNFAFKVSSLLTVDRLNGNFLDYVNYMANQSPSDFPTSTTLQALLTNLYATSFAVKNAFNSWIANNKITPSFETIAVQIYNALSSIDETVKTTISSSFDSCMSTWQGTIASNINTELALMHNCTIQQKIYLASFFSSGRSILSSYDTTFNSLVISPAKTCSTGPTNFMLNCALAIANNNAIRKFTICKAFPFIVL